MWLGSVLLISNVASLVLASKLPNLTDSEYLFIADRGIALYNRPQIHQPTVWNTSIRRVGLDYTSPTIIREFDPFNPWVTTGAHALTHDPTTNQLYIATDRGIYRTNVDGSNPELVFVTNTQGAWAMSLAVSGGKLYFGTAYDGLIRTLDLDRGQVEMFMNVSQGLNYPGAIGDIYLSSYTWAAGLAIDGENEQIYWSTFAGSLPHGGSIRRATLQPNATDVEVLLQDIYSPGQIRLLSNGDLYWSDGATINRARISSSKGITLEPETLFNSSQSSTMKGDYGIIKIESFTVDEKSQRLWLSGDDWDSRIVEMGINGGDAMLVIHNSTNIGFPMGLEFISQS